MPGDARYNIADIPKCLLCARHHGKRPKAVHYKRKKNKTFKKKKEKEMDEINFNNILLNPMYLKYYHKICNQYETIIEFCRSFWQ